MKEIGSYTVILRGIDYDIETVIYEDNGKYFIMWNDDRIEVYAGTHSWKTVEKF